MIAASLTAFAAFATAPSSLYGIYKSEDHLSPFTITLVYAVFAAGIVTSLLLVGHISDWYGRRTVLIPAALTGLAGAIVFASSTSLMALCAGRILTGLAIGATVATATAYLADLDAGSSGAATLRSQIVATVANVGGLAVGPLIVGVLAAYVVSNLRLIFAVVAVVLALSSIGILATPEVRALPRPRPHYRPQRLRLPASARHEFTAALVGVLLVFTVYGVYAGLSTTFLAGTLHRTSPVLAGLGVFVSFGSGLLVQVATVRWPLRRLLLFGIPVMIVGLAVLVSAAWVSPPRLPLFFAGALLAGGGSGAIYRASLAVVFAATPASDRGGALALFFVVGYVGLSLPVVAAGIALLSVSLKVILLVFGAVVSTSLLLAAPVLLRLTTTDEPR